MPLDMQFRGVFVKEQSLHQIMNEMASRLEVLRPPAPKKKAPMPLSELEAFMQMDDLLTSLNKDYLDAKAQRIELVALYGDDDAMAEVAMDMEDSAWCAMQTRYLELREEQELMERAQRLMRKAEERIENEKASEKAYEAQQVAHYVKTLANIKEMNKTPKIFEWAFLMLIFKLEPFNDKPAYMKQAMAA